jgi:hypothetical protein
MADYADVSEVEEIKSRYAHYPSVGATIRICRLLGIEEDNFRTIKEDDAWAYFRELLSEVASAMPREQLYDSLASYLSPGEIETHLRHIEQLKRTTA